MCKEPQTWLVMGGKGQAGLHRGGGGRGPSTDVGVPTPSSGLHLSPFHPLCPAPSTPPQSPGFPGAPTPAPSASVVSPPPGSLLSARPMSSSPHLPPTPLSSWAHFRSPSARLTYN